MPTTDADPCRACGACCDFPEPWSVVDLTMADTVRIPAAMTTHSWGNRVKMRREGNRCVALVGTIGLDARCSIYDIRPEVCRDYDPDARTKDCEVCRNQHGLAGQK